MTWGLKMRSLKINFSRRSVIISAMTIFLIITCLIGCGTGGGLANMPYEPDTPAPDPHNGTFVSDHGTMEFNGDGVTVKADFDGELSELLGLPEGKQELNYVFLSGDLPPVGSVEVRYDVAHELMLSTAEVSVVVEMALAHDDGTVTLGVDTVTPERIPMYFRTDTQKINIIFTKQ